MAGPDFNFDWVSLSPTVMYGVAGFLLIAVVVVGYLHSRQPLTQRFKQFPVRILTFRKSGKGYIDEDDSAARVKLKEGEFYTFRSDVKMQKRPAPGYGSIFPSGRAIAVMDENDQLAWVTDIEVVESAREVIDEKTGEKKTLPGKARLIATLDWVSLNNAALANLETIFNLTNEKEEWYEEVVNKGLYFFLLAMAAIGVSWGCASLVAWVYGNALSAQICTAVVHAAANATALKPPV